MHRIELLICREKDKRTNYKRFSFHNEMFRFSVPHEEVLTLPSPSLESLEGEGEHRAKEGNSFSCWLSQMAFKYPSGKFCILLCFQHGLPVLRR